MEEVIGWLIATLVVGYIIFKFFKKFIKIVIFLVFAIVLTGVVVVKKVYDKVVNHDKTEQVESGEEDIVEEPQQDIFKENVVVTKYVHRDVAENEFYISNDTTYVYYDIRKDFDVISDEDMNN
jgi:voltage-gated potassium channel Kch